MKIVLDYFLNITFENRLKFQFDLNLVYLFKKNNA